MVHDWEEIAMESVDYDTSSMPRDVRRCRATWNPGRWVAVELTAYTSMLQAREELIGTTSLTKGAVKEANCVLHCSRPI